MALAYGFLHAEDRFFYLELACYVLKEGKVNWDQSIISILSRGWRCLPWGYF